MSKTWFTADTHFNHANRVKYSNYSSVDEMNERMIFQWNSSATDEDTIYHLGDFAFGSQDKINDILDELNGNIVLILGNHDHNKRKFYEEHPKFIEVCESKIIKILDRQAHLYHYPILDWFNRRRGTIHLHGHTHGMLDFTIAGSLDVGIAYWQVLLDEDDIFYHIERSRGIRNVAINHDPNDFYF